MKYPSISKQFAPFSLSVLALAATCDSALAQAAAPAGAGGQPSFGEVFSSMLPMFATIFLVFYFMVVRPQQKKQQTHESLLGSLKKGETVVTTGGIIGRVAGIESDHILVEADRDVRLKVEKAHIASRYEKKAAEGGAS